MDKMQQLLNQPFWLAAIGIVLLLLLAAGFALYRYWRSDKRKLKRALRTHAKAVCEDAVLFDGVDSYQFADYLLLLPGRIVVIKRNNSEGYIFGGENIHEWTCVKNNVTGKFANPLEKLNHFATQIKREFGFEAVEACVLFSSGASFPKGVPDQVLQMNKLDQDLEKLSGDESEHAQAEAVWQRLMEMVAKDKREVEQH